MVVQLKDVLMKTVLKNYTSLSYLRIRLASVAIYDQQRMSTHFPLNHAINTAFGAIWQHGLISSEFSSTQGFGRWWAGMGGGYFR
jgi:hypothetical protein